MEEEKEKMRFKNHNQRKAVMAKLTYGQLKNRGVNLHPYKDSDRDGVKNYKDCRPLDPKEQGWLHDWQIKRLKQKEEKLESKREKAQEKLNDTLDELKERRKAGNLKSKVKQTELKRKQAIIDEISREKKQAEKLRMANEKAKKEIEKYSAWGKFKRGTGTAAKFTGKRVAIGSKRIYKTATSPGAKKGYKRLGKKLKKILT